MRYDKRSGVLSLAVTNRPRHRREELGSGLVLHFDRRNQLAEIELSGITPAPVEWLGPGPRGLPQVQKHQAALIAAFDNATSLHRDGRALFRGRSWGRAAALAVTGYEEVGKVVAYHLLIIGHVKPESVNALLKLLRRSHSTKQVLAYVANVIGDITRRIRPIIDGVPVSPESTLDDVTRAINSVLPQIIEAISCNAEAVEIETTVSNILEGRMLDDLKHRGLYVDVSPDGQLRIPAAVTRKEANQALCGLWWALRGVSILRPAAQLPPAAVALIRGWIQEPEVTRQIEKAGVRSP